MILVDKGRWRNLGEKQGANAGLTAPPIIDDKLGEFGGGEGGSELQIEPRGGRAGRHGDCGGGRKIRFNSINPGPIETDGVHAQGLIETFRQLGEKTVLGRIGQPDDIGPAALYLASDDAAWVTGQTLYVNGGTR